MKLKRIIILLTIVLIAGRLQAQSSDSELRRQLAAARAENASLKKLVIDLSNLSKQLNADLAVERHAAKKVRQELVKAAKKYTLKTTADKDKAMEYKLALAENTMLRARIKSLLRSTGSSTSKPADDPRNRKHVRLIQIELHEDLWKWWSDPILLSEHISLRRKLTHLDVDHSLDAWLTRRGQFAGTKVNWNMRFVSGAITSKKKIDLRLKQAEKDLSATLQAVVFGSKSPIAVDNAKYRDSTIAALATTQPKAKSTPAGKKPKTAKTDPHAGAKKTNFRMQIRNLQEKIELYKLASAAGGLTTVYAVAGDIAVKIALPGRHFERVSRADQPRVKIVGSILRAAPKAGYFIGRTDTMMQFEVSGKCTLKNPPAAQPESE